MRKFTFRWLLSLIVILGFTFNSNAQIFQDDFSTDQGWTLNGSWERNTAIAEPSADYGGDGFILANPLGSDYFNYAAREEVLSPVIDCSTNTTVVIDYMSFSGCESSSYDHMGVEVYDGATWHTVWTNGASFQENAWTNYIIDVTAYAAGNANFQVKFYMGTTDASVQYSGFAIDNFVVRELSTETDFLTFSFPSDETGPATIDATAHTIDIEVAASTDLTTLVANYSLSPGASADILGTVQTSGTTVNNFSAPVTYTVTAEDGTTTQDWTVTVSQAMISSETDFTAYSFAEETGAATIDAGAHTIDIEVNWQANITNLTASFIVSVGASADIAGTPQISGTTTNDFSAPITYTVTAEDGTTTQDWIVTVTQEAIPQGLACSNPFNYGNINDPAVSGTVQIATYNWYSVVLDQDYVNVSFNTCGGAGGDSRLWVYDACGGTVLGYSDDDCAALSEVTFSTLAAGTYYVAIDEFGQNAILDYVLEVTGNIPNSEANILTYSFPEATGSALIDDIAHTVSIEVGIGTDLSTLTANFTLSAGATADVSGTPQTSGVSVNDFSGGAVNYNVTSEDLSTLNVWSVTVTVAASLNNETDILTYSFAEETGTATIDPTNHTVDIEVNWQADLSNLVPTYTLSYGATTTQTTNDFTSPVTYTITAEDGTTTQDWIVTVTQEAVPQGVDCSNPFTYTNINDAPVSGTIQIGTYNWYSVVLDQDYVNVSFNTCGGAGGDSRLWVYDACGGTELGYSDDDCGLLSEVTFSTLAAGTYYVAIDEYGQNAILDYVLEVTGTLASDAEITAYALPGQTSSSIVAASDSIMVLMPAGTTYPITLAADFTLSTNATATVGGTAQTSTVTDNTWNDNVTPVDYVVLGEDGITTRTWSVYVDVAQGVNNLNASNIKIYPNPNNGLFNLVLNGQEISNIEIVNAQGKVVANLTEVIPNQVKSIDLTNQSAGLYFVRITNNANSSVLKVNIVK
ncbi:MAG: T9SS type A sorting domain-containing protein [Bacteroidales bacterium]|nr:T9SS type A sorting domain-containing protein [Bacteroidales bacterium]